MKLFAAFLAHEARVQMRSGRFRLLAVVYTLVCTAPALIPVVLAGRATYVVGASMYASMLSFLQPVTTTIVAAVLSIDAISREQQENSFRVISLAPMSSSSYTLNRWLSVVTILVPLTALPAALTAALSYGMTGRVHDSLLWNWLLRIVPLAITYSAFAFALGTITARTILAAIAGVALLTFGVGIANDILAHWHRQLGDVYGGVIPDRGVIDSFVWALRGWGAPPLPTEAPFDIAAALDEFTARNALIAGLAAILLGATPLMLRRTRRDVRPRPVRDDHSLRTFLKSLNRFRDDFTPDGAIEWREIFVAITGALLLSGALATLIARETNFQRLARERYDVETSSNAPTPSTIAIVAMNVSGTIDDDGAVRTHSTLTIRNSGMTPVRALAFSINPSLHVSARALTTQQRWNRMTVALEPALAANASRTIDFDISGTPGDIDFPIYNPFISRYPRFRDAKTAIDLRPMALSTFVASANRKQLSMPLSDLAPLPRFTKWELVTSNDDNPKVREEEIAINTALHLDLRLPRGVTVAESCGSISSNARLVTDCTTDVAQHQLFGGHLRAMNVGANVTFAYLPPHHSLATLHAQSLQEALNLVANAWPDIDRRERMVFVERPSEELERYYGDYNAASGADSIRASGSLQLLPELMLVRRKPLQPGALAASLLAHTLFERRLIQRDQQHFFRAFYSTVARARVGEPMKGGAVEPAIGGSPETDPILTSPRVRLRRVLADVENRVGSDRLVAGINDFLSASRTPGNAKELLDAIGRRANLSLDRIYTDYFLGRLQPQLTLTGVVFHRSGDKWEVTGNLINRGEGEAFCPIVLRTAYESLTRVIRVDTHETVPFVIVTPYTPHSLQLDPEKVCYRYAAIGLVDNVEFRGER